MRQVARFQSPQDIIAMLWRRKWQVLIPGLALLATSVIVALAWPRTYQAKATILIVGPGVSENIIEPSSVDRADQRVQVISQQILSRQNLLRLIDKFDLYPEATEKKQLLMAADGLRKSIQVNFISAEVSDPRMFRPGQATIAFTLSFIHEDPATAQKVLEELVSLYLAENERTLKAKASETTEFLAKESEKLATQIRELETKLAEFKEKNQGSLPEQVPMNQQAMYRMELQLLELRHQIQAQEERKVYLESQLTQISPYASITLDNGTVLQPEDRLKKLESEYSELSYTYGPKHPRMVEIATEIENLRKSMGLNAQSASQEPSNPAYIQLQAELRAVKSTLSALKSQQEELSKRFDVLENQVTKAPEIEREYLVLTRNHEDATSTYKAVKEKLWKAKQKQSLETESKGDHFEVIEPPELPLVPIAPNRKLLVVIGLLIAAVGGVGTATVAEVLDQTISGPRHLAAITGAAPLVVIPVIEVAGNRSRAFGVSLLLVAGLTTILATGLFARNEFIAPIDELSAKLGPGTGAT